jgi:oxygen-independent coproporphyrinogen-3 oxidase
MRPDRLAVYNYAHLPQRFKGQRMIDEADLPEAAAKLEILHRTIDRLGDAGYVYIGMDHFALPDDALVRARLDGGLQRNFQGYSTHGDCDLVGLGASSISSIGNVYAQNAVTTDLYETLIENGQLPIRKGIVVDIDDRLRAAVIQTLMCHDRLSFDTYEAQHGVKFRRYFKRELEQLRPLVNDGLTTVDRDGISITPKGRLLLRSIAMIFDRYIDTELTETRFSKAI